MNSELPRVWRTILCVLLFLAQQTSVDAQVGSRDPRQQPFSSASFWNIPLGRDAQFQSSRGLETATLRDQNAGGAAGAYPWVGADAFGIYYQKPTDPVMRWQYEARSVTGPWIGPGPLRRGTFELRTPPDIRFLGGSDGHAVIVTDDAKFAYEFWKGSYDSSSNSYRATYVVLTDLRGTGKASRDGASEGIRAFGGSLLGGLIRCGELERGVISHGVAMVISTTQLRRGTTQAEQKVWPATTTDHNSIQTYSGAVPMGAHFAIPPSIDLRSLDLTREGLALAQAYASFGGYVVDAAIKTNMIAVVEAGCDKRLTDNLTKDKLKILNHLHMVTNSGPEAIGGPGVRAVSPPPDLDRR